MHMVHGAYSAVKILLSFYQLITKVDVVPSSAQTLLQAQLKTKSWARRHLLPQVYLIKLPADVKQLLSTFTVGVSFGLGSTDSVLTCLNLSGFLNQVSLLSTAAQKSHKLPACPLDEAIRPLAHAHS